MADKAATQSSSSPPVISKPVLSFSDLLHLPTPDTPCSRTWNQVFVEAISWKERVDGWKMKHEENTGPVNTQAASERGGGDIDASTDILVDEALLNDEARQPLPYNKSSAKCFRSVAGLINT
ncbi:hypothetical protein CARUB_v10006042mg [Capsella rubella]|uniref:Uncharacterized protein n=1 Tax=Capsella rubella TaxID=81985 RepID=R0H2E7_9BRAS|nr:hypothetical protein CARUB_v10006042mg [Capsella rubella]